MGSARSSQIARDRAADVEQQLAAERKQRELQRKQELYEAQLVALQGQYETERDAILNSRTFRWRRKILNSRFPGGFLRSLVNRR